MPDSVPGLVAKAASDLEDGKLVQVRASLARLDELAPGRRDVRTLHAALAWVEHDREETAAILEDLLRDAPLDGRPEREIGKHLSELYRFAEAVDCPVILIADIDKGGVFAHLVGTLALLSASEQVRVQGFVINRFRGDIALLQPGLDWLEQRTGKPVLGVLPYLMDFHLEAEDAIDVRQSGKAGETLKVVVPVLPRVSNHTDFDPLRLVLLPYL